MNSETLNELLAGAEVSALKRTCDLIMFSLSCADGKILCLHATCFVRMSLPDGVTIACSCDLYERGKNNKKGRFRWDQPMATLFDESIVQEEHRILHQKIKQVRFERNRLELYLENGILIEFVPDSVSSEYDPYKENYRLFAKGGEDFLVV